MKSWAALGSLLLLLISACGDDDGPAPAPDGGGIDAPGTDAGPPMRIEDLPVDETHALPGLEGDVEVVIDDRGMPHIYATTDHDALIAQGYLMARDRFGQMELIRRSVTGRTAEFGASLDEGTVDNDIAARIEGHARNAEAIWASLPEGDETRTAVLAFSEGINVYIDELLAGQHELPYGAEALNFIILTPGRLTDWMPQDSIAIGRYLSHALSYSAGDDIGRSEGLIAVAREFPASSPDPRLAARAGIFQDFWPIAPVRDVFTRVGFPNEGTDTGTRALRPPPRARPWARSSWSPDEGALRRSEGFLEVIRRRAEMFALQDRGSNNWVVRGTKTASGAPLLANDPHLSLVSPPLFWYVHLDTARQGGGTLQGAGLALAGAPGVILGWNQNIAWGVTTTGYDVTDVYEETITEGAGGAPDTVLFEGAQVPIERRMETIVRDVGDPVVVEYEVVPHHGPIVPEIRGGTIVPRTDTRALSVRWTGHEPSNEVGAFVGLLRAANVDDARAAVEQFEVGSQNFVVISRDDDIFWSTQARIPVRDPAAMTYDLATNPTGYSPCHVLPGTGEAEWVGELEDRYIPHDLNPERGFIATANQDNVGVTADGDALDDPHFLGCEFDPGHREARITELLEEVTADAMATPDDMQRIQGDAQSALGRRLSAALIASLDRAEEERATPGTHADLTLAVTEIGATKLAKVRMMRDRLTAWADAQWRAPDGLEDDPSEAGLRDSIAATIFNAALPHLATLAFADEAERLGHYPWNGYLARPLEWSLLTPERLATYDAALGDTVLWDDLETVAVESRDDRVVRAFAAALDWLEANHGTDMAQWQWGKLHTVRFATMIPPTNPSREPLSIPPIPSRDYMNGFPRHGDLFGIDAANFDIFPGEPDFTYGSGPQQRLVVEMTPDGPNIWNALPGGQRIDPDDPHHADEAELWRRNQADPIWFRELDVVQHAETRIRFTP